MNKDTQATLLSSRVGKSAFPRAGLAAALSLRDDSLDFSIETWKPLMLTLRWSYLQQLALAEFALSQGQY